MPLSDRCDPAAERQSGRSGGGVRRNGFADRLWPAGFGDAAFPGDDGFDRGVHVDVHFAFDHCHEERRTRQRIGVAAPSDEDLGSGHTCASEEIITVLRGLAEVAELADALA